MDTDKITQQLNEQNAKNDEEYYVWVNSNLDRCNLCQDLNQKFFRKSDGNIPPKPHPNCRCELRKITGERNIKAIEQHFSSLDQNLVKNQPVTFKGWNQKRHSMHDDLIAKIVTDFNANKMEYAGCTREQAAKIPDLSANLVKAWLIQESGGSDSRSLAAWLIDPAQVNVPGDWDLSAKAKSEIGLNKPKKRNEGNVKDNLKAAVKFLVRKGFVPSAGAQRERPEGYFDSWKDALERYNGNPAIEKDGRPHYKHYAEKILRRAADPNVYEPNERQW